MSAAVSASPFQQAVNDYRDRGWLGTLPLPSRAKWPPPNGFTGAAGADPSTADVLAWVEGDEGCGNIALRLPDDVIGIDVDAYGNKVGAQTLARLERELGPLPHTWTSTSREDRLSGIRLFRVSPDLSWRDVGADIETIRRAHRYVVAAPSVHPEGGCYRWFGTADWKPTQPPYRTALPELPQRWVDYLTAQDGDRPVSGWTDPDLDALVEHGIASGTRQDDVLRDVVWRLRGQGVGRSGTQSIWRSIVARTGLTRPGEPWTERDFSRHWDGANKKHTVTVLPTAAGATVQQPGRHGAQLAVRRFADLAADVDARGPRRWLIRGIWPAGDYGVHGAEPKAGKTWNALDLAVSVASGTDWLGAVPIDTAGPVIVFAGEGGDGNLVRRVRAIAARRGLDDAALPMWICTRAPHLSNEEHLAELVGIIAEVRPALVVLDPLYLAAGGANGADLYAMGKLLERPQHICQQAGAALCVVTHYNRARDLKGAARLTGAGPAEWGRVLIGAEVVSRHTDPATNATTVLSELVVTGGEVPDQTLRVRRVVRAIDPDNLDSPLEYTVDTPDANDVTVIPAGGDLKPAAGKLLAALEAQEQPTTSRALVDWIVDQYGHGLQRETVSRSLNDLQRRGLVDCLDQGVGVDKLWFRPTNGDNP